MRFWILIFSVLVMGDAALAKASAAVQVRISLSGQSMNVADRLDVPQCAMTLLIVRRHPVMVADHRMIR